MMVSSFWIFLLIASTWDCNCNACAAKARSCSGGHLVEVGRESHAADCARAETGRRQANRPKGRRLQHADHTACADSLPRQAQHQRLELFAVEFDLAAMANAGPVKLALIESSRRKPDTHAVVHQHFHPVSPAIGEQISAVRLRRTERRDHSG